MIRMLSLVLTMFLFLVGCTKAENTDKAPAKSVFMEACSQYNRLLHCESVLSRERLQSYPCETVQDVYELSCKPDEIGFAKEMLTKNADDCWKIAKAKGSAFSRTFDMARFSQKCLKAEHG